MPTTCPQCGYEIPDKNEPSTAPDPNEGPATAEWNSVVSKIMATSRTTRPLTYAQATSRAAKERPELRHAMIAEYNRNRGRRA